MARFCPYCGKQLGERSRFCPRCGKASPERRRTGAVAVEERSDLHPRHAAGAPRTASSSLASDGVERPPSGDSGEASRWSSVRTTASPPVPGSRVSAGLSGKSVRGRHVYAPATHAMIGAFEQAGFGLRYGAWMFDFLITLIAMMSFTFVVSYLSKSSVVGSNRDLVIVASLTLLLFLLNFVVLAGMNGQSAGMRILGIRIARLDGKPFTVKHAAVRHLIGYPVSTIAFFLGFLWMLWDPNQQGWHDKLARTIVVMSR